MENSIVVFILGLATGILLTARPEMLRNMGRTQYAYILLGLALLGASVMAGWIGFTCVIVAFVLYHVFNSEMRMPNWGNMWKWIKSLFSWRRKPSSSTEIADALREETKPVVGQLVGGVEEVLQPTEETVSEFVDRALDCNDRSGMQETDVDDPVAQQDAMREKSAISAAAGGAYPPRFRESKEKEEDR